MEAKHSKLCKEGKLNKSLESLVEAVERLCSPDIGRVLVSPLRCQNRDEL